MARISETVKFRETRHTPLDSGFQGGHFMSPTFFDDSQPIWKNFEIFDFFDPHMAPNGPKTAKSFCAQ